jgi:hypothetical protein
VVVGVATSDAIGLFKSRENRAEKREEVKQGIDHVVLVVVNVPVVVDNARGMKCDGALRLVG